MGVGHCWNNPQISKIYHNKGEFHAHVTAQCGLEVDCPCPRPSVFWHFPAALVGRGPSWGGEVSMGWAWRDTHHFHLHPWTKLSHMTTSDCQGKWSNHTPRRKRKAWTRMSTVISETAESELCKPETAMRETISVSFPGKFSGGTAMELHDDITSSQASKASHAS